MVIQAVVYTADGPQVVESIQEARERPGTAWIRIEHATDDAVRQLETVFGIHGLSTDDTMANVRATVHEFDEYTFILMKAARLASGETSFAEEVTEDPVGLFFGTDWVVSLSPGRVDSIDEMWETALHPKQNLLDRGADFVVYRIIDGLVDDYFEILDQIEIQIERIEDAVITTLDTSVLADINNVRRELLSIRKLLIPGREAASSLARGDSPNVRPESEKYFRDVYENLIQLVELTETYRELATGARDIYLNALSMSTNEVMKRLTAVATILLPLTVITGLYGMNFRGSPYNMPELTWIYGYPAVLLAMALVAFTSGVYFSRQGWL
ncbi:magnesium and cobalt transport protein CorA [Halogranum salarium B-1]|uniref:Magnesium transport protein CorA n=1 Tax=Halogranum salarium B-1 TaxID=1210908 RepID=J2ZJP1_9EURY|nr:magnesium and cobalt transport protein CorA [Halogranum salarium B-1]